MNYAETLDYLYNSLPMFQRIGIAAIRKDLTNIRKLCTILREPQNAFISVHIAGTNGKGSTSHMLAAIFQCAGYKTGLYTSPHYVDFRERIRINGEMIPHEAVVNFVEKYRDQWELFKPSFFEITVAMAFDHFRNENVEIAIIETGLGGRLDSTNIITPVLSVITNIGFDHMQMLGDSLPQIAFEKAGIIKENVPVVIGEQKKETAPVFIEKASEMNAPVYFTEELVQHTSASGDFNLKQYCFQTEDKELVIESTLTGPYQVQNIQTVIASWLIWNRHYPEWQIEDKALIRGLKEVKQLTGMLGRWMILGNEPLTIADAAHNTDGIRSILPDLLRIPSRRRHFVLGFVADKEIDKILALFPGDAHYYWCRPDIPRGKDVLETAQEGKELGLFGNTFASVQDAYHAALKAATNDDLVFIGGSSYVVGDLLSTLSNG